MRILLVLIIGLICCFFLPSRIGSAQHEVCGNGSCEAGETCETCLPDCGACQTNNPDDDDEVIPPTTPPTTIQEQLEEEQLKTKKVSEFSLQGGAVDDLQILWP